MDNNNNQNNYAYIPHFNVSYNYNPYVNKPPKKNRHIFAIVLMSLLVVAFVTISTLFFMQKMDVDDSNKKTRTFMIYMVGSDLESASSQGTYSIDEIDPSKIDLDNNNIILMVGGAKKWHNFVNPDEVAIYELTTAGFVKKENDFELNMGEESSLTTFLNYSYNNYPAKKYDMILWNHGLGAFGLELDEIADDFINIYELDNAFKNSKFKNEKLELTIFYNCLTENIHMANIMSKYSDYMLGSEEIIYLSKLFNRLKFFEKVKVDDTAVDIAKYFIDQSDVAIDNYNNTHIKKINSTLSLLDLSKFEQFNDDLEKFIATIDVSKNYYSIARIRRNMYTYGRNQNNDYDTVDLYSLIEELEPYTNNTRLLNNLKSSINDLIVINSASDNYSHGISAYFPYFSGNDIINAHLIMFEKLWSKSSYVSFIRNFNSIRYVNGRETKQITGKETNELTNEVSFKDNKIEITLDENENAKYQSAYVYIFKKDKDNNYELLLKSDKVNHDNNKLVYNYNGLLKINDTLISFFDLKEKNVYGKLTNKYDQLNILFSLYIDKESSYIIEAILDSGSNPLSSIIDMSDYNRISFAKLKYNYFDRDTMTDSWKDNYNREDIEYDKDSVDIIIDKVSLKDCYIMIEIVDLDNDSYYSKMLHVE